MIGQTWLTRYPRPEKVICDRGTEFMAEFRNMITNIYGIKQKVITSRNPQANAIVERVHQTLGNMLRTYRINHTKLDEENPWTGILTAIAFAIRATVHTTLKYSPMQLVFGRDPFFNIKNEVNWQLVNENRKKRAVKNNENENKKRIPYTYKIGEKVLVKTNWATKYRTVCNKENTWQRCYLGKTGLSYR